MKEDGKKMESQILSGTFFTFTRGGVGGLPCKRPFSASAS